MFCDWFNERRRVFAILFGLIAIVVAVVSICMGIHISMNNNAPACECKNNVEVCSWNTKVYKYSECKKYGILYDKTNDRLIYSVFADVRWYAVITLGSAFVSMTIYLTVILSILNLGPYTAASYCYRLIVNGDSDDTNAV